MERCGSSREAQESYDHQHGPQHVVSTIDHDMPTGGVDAPRLHHQWFPDEARIDASRTVQAGRAPEPWATALDGSPQGRHQSPSTSPGMYIGAADKA